MKALISGGCKNGKSYYAQRLAKAWSASTQLYYIATMEPADAEDDARIIRHRGERDGWGFTTIEQPRNIERILDKCDPGGTYLLDSATALLANEMFRRDGSVNDGAAVEITRGLLKLAEGVENIVIVSDYIYSDAQLYEPLTEAYRKSLAQIDRALAVACDIVIEVVFTSVVVHKNTESVYEAIF